MQPEEKNITPGEPEQTFTIDEAAEYIGVKRRTFENFKLTAISEMRTAKDSKARRINVYSLSQLDEIKAEREKPIIKPSAGMQTYADQIADVPTREDFKMLVELVAGSLQQNKKLLEAMPETKKKIIDTTPYRDKFILNFNQAFHLSGLTQAELKTALEEKKIKAGKNGNRWQIERESLLNYCKAKFE